jgi:hypothetical protein
MHFSRPTTCLTVNCNKTYQICKVPGSPDFVPPAVWMTHIDGTLKQVKTLKSDDRFTYLGIECSLTLNDWSEQHQSIEFKFLDKANRVRYSKASAQRAVKLFNQDCFPMIVTYSMGPVSYPRPFRKTLQGIVCKALKQKGHFQSAVPYSCYSVPRSQNGLGLDSIHVLYSSEKVKFLRNVRKTPDTYCRLTSLECLDAIHQKLSFRRDVLRPSLVKIHSRNAAWNHLPDFYKEGHEALFKPWLEHWQKC